MCRRVQCSRCGKPTFAGCGAHVEQVLADVPPRSRCRCREESSKPNFGSQPQREQGSWLQHLFRKR
jgi:hypothetical protein